MKLVPIRNLWPDTPGETPKSGKTLLHRAKLEGLRVVSMGVGKGTRHFVEVPDGTDPCVFNTSELAALRRRVDFLETQVRILMGETVPPPTTKLVLSGEMLSIKTERLRKEAPAITEDPRPFRVCILTENRGELLTALRYNLGPTYEITQRVGKSYKRLPHNVDLFVVRRWGDHERTEHVKKHCTSIGAKWFFHSAGMSSLEQHIRDIRSKSI